MKTIPRIVFIGYIAIILIGALFLILPIAGTGARISFIDGLFTATSAVCVTGLNVLSTPNDFSLFGKIVILVLIQIGGLGYMAIATALFITLGRNLSIKQTAITESVMAYPYGDVRRFVIQVIKLTLAFELLGTLILSYRFWATGVGNAPCFVALFFSVSAFCNAGFSLFSNSLIPYILDPVVVFTVAGLLIAGGLGFIIHRELFWRLTHRKKFLSLHTKLAILTSLILIFAGTTLFCVMEWNGVLSNLSIGTKIRSAFFQAVTPRTAGFSVVPLGECKNASLFFTMILMFLGASPGGTGGGIKITTIAVILLAIFSFFRNQQNPVSFRKRIGNAIVTKAYTVIFVSILLVITGAFILSISEGNKGFLPLLFEAVSAFGTVGLSVGGSNPACSLAYDFSVVGKLVIIFTMLAGRVGTLTIGSIFIQPIKREIIKYPKDDVLIG